jgi:NAD(P) transhydrogenase subunit alpha
MRIGVPTESGVRERRVALTPAAVATLVGEGHQVDVQSGAGLGAGFSDDAYRDAGASVAERDRVIGTDGVIVAVDGPEAGPTGGPGWGALGPDHVVIALHDPLGRPEGAEALARTGAVTVSLELIPRITRAQSMDVLSSMATVAGYEAVLLAATRVSRMVPMLMTAAGTVPPARFLVLGAGVAGLQALATARRLGAVVEGYDVRPAAQEQIRSLGARAIELELDAEAEGTGGYATELTDEQNRRQLERLAPHVADADVVITTAAVPGAVSPELITTPMVEAMGTGSVIVDLAAARGGNCRLTRPDEEVVHHGVIILGPTDLASRAPTTSSQMFANNLVTLLRHLTPDGVLTIDLDDEITAATVVTMGGEVRHPAVRARLGPSGPAGPSGGGEPSGRPQPAPSPIEEERR